MKKRVIIIGSVIASIVAIIFAVRGVNNVIRKQKFDDLIANADNVKVGDIIEFGPYEWKVLDKDGKRLLIITKDIVAWERYYEKSNEIMWGDCALRKWLNNEFYTSEFNVDERARIKTTDIVAGSRIVYVGGVQAKQITAGPECDTQDKVFLLSPEEVEKYFKEPSERLCKYLGDISDWWLRVYGEIPGDAKRVKSDGKVEHAELGPVPYGNPYYGVRPALWLNLEN